MYPSQHDIWGVLVVKHSLNWEISPLFPSHSFTYLLHHTFLPAGINDSSVMFFMIHAHSGSLGMFSTLPSEYLVDRHGLLHKPSWSLEASSIILHIWELIKSSLRWTFYPFSVSVELIAGLMSVFKPVGVKQGTLQEGFLTFRVTVGIAASEQIGGLELVRII